MRDDLLVLAVVPADEAHFFENFVGGIDREIENPVFLAYPCGKHGFSFCPSTPLVAQQRRERGLSPRVFPQCGNDSRFGMNNKGLQATFALKKGLAGLPDGPRRAKERPKRARQRRRAYIDG
jgi:hypothetical protein